MSWRSHWHKVLSHYLGESVPGKRNKYPSQVLSVFWELQEAVVAGERELWGEQF